MVDARCTFCAIVRGEARASVVHDDDVVLAFMDLRPVSAGHVLVIPKSHLVGLDDLDEQVGSRMWRVAHRLGRALRRSGLRCEGVSLSLADGQAAGQEVFHVHLHVFPRFVGDGYRVDADWRERDRHVLDESADAVRRGLSGLG